MSAWNALEAELNPSDPGSALVRTPASEDTPTYPIRPGGHRVCVSSADRRRGRTILGR
jgi:hypothetical protein